MINIQQLIQQHQSNDPFEIAENLGIRIIKENLGSLNGYFHSANDVKLIHINNNLTYKQQLFTAAHELGHALLHPNSNTPFLKNHTHFSVNKLEIEANAFAVNLLISDEDIREQLQYENYTISQLACIFGMHEKLIELRMKNFQKYNFNKVL